MEHKIDDRYAIFAPEIGSILPGKSTRAIDEPDIRPYEMARPLAASIPVIRTKWERVRVSAEKYQDGRQTSSQAALQQGS